MKKKIILTLAVILLPILAFFSCCHEVDPNFNIQGIDSYALFHSPDGVGSVSKVTTELDTVPFAKHFIGVNFKIDYYSHHSKQSYSYGAVYALSCDPPGYGGSPEGLDTLYVITNKTLDIVHQANDTINDIVRVSGYIGLPSVDNTSLQEFVSDNKNIIREQTFRLSLSQEPEYKQETHSFTVVVKLRNGEQYEATTNEIRFK